MNEKRKISSVDLARALLDTYVDEGRFDDITHLSLDEAQAERYHAKMRFYRLALVLKVLNLQEKQYAGYSGVRESLERLTFPPSQGESVPFVTALRAAMNDIADLISTKNAGQGMLWARSWLSDIGIDENNPVTVSLLAMKWLDAIVTVTKMIQEWQPT